MSELRSIFTHKKLAEHPDGPVKFELETCHCFKWSIIANPLPGDCYELCLNAEQSLTDAPENLKNHLEGRYGIHLAEWEPSYKPIRKYLGKLAPGLTTVTREVPKSVLINRKTEIQLIVVVESALGLDEWQEGKSVKLDIGGTIFHTTPTTIYKYFSRLKRDFEFHREFHIKSDSIEHYSLLYRDNLFYDRDSKYFRYILNFLRDGDNMKLPKNREKIEEILEEAKFWMLKELEELCQRKLDISSDF
ncbi:unnamed protein product [Caenorhabditis nigoni]